MEYRRAGGLRSFMMWLLRAVVASGCVTLFAGGSYGQSETSGLPIGAEAIKRMLTDRKQWTLYWFRAPVIRPRRGSATADRSPSAALEFMRVGRGLMGHAENDQLHYAECDFEVTVREDGFVFAGCWGSDKFMAYDPDDREYPFKGRVEGTSYWLGRQ